MQVPQSQLRRSLPITPRAADSAASDRATRGSVGGAGAVKGPARSVSTARRATTPAEPVQTLMEFLDTQTPRLSRAASSRAREYAARRGSVIPNEADGADPTPSGTAAVWDWADAPIKLFVATPNGHRSCAGWYGLVPEQFAHGCPFWVLTGGPYESKRWLYSTADGRWCIGDVVDQRKRFSSAVGFLFTGQPHGGVLPNVMPVGSWHRWDGKEKSQDPFISVSQDPPIPPRLKLSSPAAHRHCNGKYELAPFEEVHGFPVWRHRLAPRWLFSDPDGKWRVGDTEERKSRPTDFFSSAAAHGGLMPGVLKCGWQILDGKEKRTDFAITVCDDDELDISGVPGLEDEMETAQAARDHSVSSSPPKAAKRPSKSRDNEERRYTFTPFGVGEDAAPKPPPLRREQRASVSRSSVTASTTPARRSSADAGDQVKAGESSHAASNTRRSALGKRSLSAASLSKAALDAVSPADRLSSGRLSPGREEGSHGSPTIPKPLNLAALRDASSELATDCQEVGASSSRALSSARARERSRSVASRRTSRALVRSMSLSTVQDEAADYKYYHEYSPSDHPQAFSTCKSMTDDDGNRVPLQNRETVEQILRQLCGDVALPLCRRLGLRFDFLTEHHCQEKKAGLARRTLHEQVKRFPDGSERKETRYEVSIRLRVRLPVFRGDPHTQFLSHNALVGVLLHELCHLRFMDHRKGFAMLYRDVCAEATMLGLLSPGMQNELPSRRPWEKFVYNAGGLVSDKALLQAYVDSQAVERRRSSSRTPVATPRRLSSKTTSDSQSSKSTKSSLQQEEATAEKSDGLAKEPAVAVAESELKPARPTEELQGRPEKVAQEGSDGEKKTRKVKRKVSRRRKASQILINELATSPTATSPTVIPSVPLLPAAVAAPTKAAAAAGGAGSADEDQDEEETEDEVGRKLAELVDVPVVGEGSGTTAVLGESKELVFLFADDGPGSWASEDRPSIAVPTDDKELAPMLTGKAEALPEPEEEFGPGSGGDDVASFVLPIGHLHGEGRAQLVSPAACTTPDCLDVGAESHEEGTAPPVFFAASAGSHEKGTAPPVLPTALAESLGPDSACVLHGAWAEHHGDSAVLLVRQCASAGNHGRGIAPPLLPAAGVESHGDNKVPFAPPVANSGSNGEDTLLPVFHNDDSEMARTVCDEGRAETSSAWLIPLQPRVPSGTAMPEAVSLESVNSFVGLSYSRSGEEYGCSCDPSVSPFSSDEAMADHMERRSTKMKTAIEALQHRYKSVETQWRRAVSRVEQLVRHQDGAAP